VEKFVIVKISNAQYKISEGMEVIIQKILGEKGDKVEFTDVLLKSNADKTEVGTPIIENSLVKAEIVEQFLGEKVSRLTYKAKSRARKRGGHRQKLTKIKIISIK